MAWEVADTTVPSIIFAATDWPTNAHMIADCKRLNYINGLVVDVTYGEGNFWTIYRPDGLVGHDKWKGDGVDFRALPEADGSVDTLVFDPPYKLSGTPALGEMDDRYGVDARHPNSWQTVHQIIRDGIKEAGRVVRSGGHLLLKCMNQVAGGKVRWQTDEFTRAAMMVGFRKQDQLEFLRKGRPQPEGTVQLHARRNLSSLLVFEKL